MFLIEVMPTMREPYSGHCDGVLLDEAGVETRFYGEQFESIKGLYIDCREGWCPQAHLEAFEAALAQKAIRDAT